MGALAETLFRRPWGRAPARPTYRFVCYLDRLPPQLPELDERFRQRSGRAAAVECELEADDFAAAVAEAIRALEHGFIHVRAIERLGHG